MGMADAAMSALYFGQKKTKGGGWMAVAVAGIITSRSRGEPLLKQMRPKSNVSQKNAKKAPDCKRICLEVVCECGTERGPRGCESGTAALERVVLCRPFWQSIFA